MIILTGNNKQQTLTGAHTTHHTNGTVFQIPDDSILEDVCVEKPKDIDVLVDGEGDDYGIYKIKTKVTLPPFPYFTYLREKSDLLNWSLHRDIAWVLVSVKGHEFVANKLDPTGSWTNFMKLVTPTSTHKYILDYLEVVPLPPNDNVCKWYLDTISKMIDDLSCDCIFLHSDEAVYSKVMMIKWAEEGKYDKIIPLLGDFHTMVVKLKILYKKYGVLGLREWWVDSGAIVEGSSIKAAEGSHYFRSINKQSFEALLRYRITKYIDQS